jgi:hypothetical protein
VRGQRHTPAVFYPRERRGTHCTGGWVCPRAGLDRCGKYRPSGIRSPDLSARSQSLYRLSYPAYKSKFVHLKYWFCRPVDSSARDGRNIRLPLATYPDQGLFTQFNIFWNKVILERWEQGGRQTRNTKEREWPSMVIFRRFSRDKRRTTRTSFIPGIRPLDRASSPSYYLPQCSITCNFNIIFQRR